MYKIFQFLQGIKIKKKDRIAAYMPHTIETVEAFIASTALGAIWSSCSPDFGTKGVIERFSQIKPKVLFVTNEYFYNGKRIDIMKRIPEIIKKIPSIKYVIINNYPGQSEKKKNYHFNRIKIFYWGQLMKLKPLNIEFDKFDFDHELVILYSSTTGKQNVCHRNGCFTVTQKRTSTPL